MKTQDCTPKLSFKELPFNDIKVGETFLPEHMNEIFLKINPVTEYGRCTLYNAVSIEDGLLSHFEATEEVYTVNGFFRYTLERKEG